MKCAIRIWCDYELYKTVLDQSKELDIATVPTEWDRKHKKVQILGHLPGESAMKKASIWLKQCCFAGEGVSEQGPQPLRPDSPLEPLEASYPLLLPFPLL